MAEKNKYREGSVVYAKQHPSVGLTIRRYVDDIYYCRINGKPEEKELVYFERELEQKDDPGNPSRH